MEHVVTRTDDLDELCHYGVKGMKWGVRRTRPKKLGMREYTNKEFELRNKMSKSGMALRRYEFAKSDKENIKFLGKEDLRDYSRSLNKTDSVYKKLYKQYENDKQIYETFIKENANNISRVKTLFGM